MLLKVIKEQLLLKLINIYYRLFLLLKPKQYVDNKQIAFQQFSNNGKAFTLGAFDLESFLLISGISGFSFQSQSIFENPETTENFQKLIFSGIKASYLILSTFLGILCVQDTTLKVLLKVINEHLLLFTIIYIILKVAFWLIKPKWYLDNKLTAFQQFSSNGKSLTLGAFLTYKAFC